MSGSWSSRLTQHTVATLHFINTDIHYNDIRRFGKFFLSSDDKTQGVDALTVKNLANHLWDSKDLKDWLLDQSILAGIGNIYASESLFLAKQSPWKKAKDCSEKERYLLLGCVKKALKKALKYGGTSIGDGTDFLVDGQKGSNKNNLFVYGRVNKPCRVCGEIIKSKKQKSRTTFFCSSCQGVAS